MIRLEHVTKVYGETMAVNDLSIEIEKGEVCVLIGPSGCGKTTTLRITNRLIEPTSGNIFIDGHDTRQVKPEPLRRSIGYAIQSVGLFPHLTVAANIATVPELLHWGKDDITRRVEELLTLVGERLQARFIRIQQALKKTVIMVTHDLDEAIRLADRIAIMEMGRLVQYDTPETILSRPANKFVHDFVGTDRALKRLSRIGIGDFIRPCPSVKTSDSIKEVAAVMANRPSVWVVDGEDKPIGWIGRGSLSEPVTARETIFSGDIREIALTNQATLREALSRMLGHGFKSIPVVDDEARLIGEITLHDVEAATANGEA